MIYVVIIQRNITGDNTVGTVTGLRPFTSYECSIHAVTKYGGPHSYYITVETLEGGIARLTCV